MLVGGNMVFQKAPYATQVVGVETIQVDASFTIDGSGGIGVELGDHDESAPVTVETDLGLAAAGGQQAANIVAAPLPLTETRGVAIDASGFIYVHGYTTSATFLMGEGTYDTTANGNNDAFVMKIAPDGYTMVWSTYFGGSSADYCDGIAIGADGSGYIGGYS
jgi:hypothetical protein